MPRRLPQSLLRLAVVAVSVGLLLSIDWREPTPWEIRYVSPGDGTWQPAMFYAPQTTDAVPLLVALHTWSGDYRQPLHAECRRWCVRHGWAFIHPDFRGPNNRPEATGSDLVVADVEGAFEYAKRAAKIDPAAVYLVGTSGGGYTALILAGRRPELWAGVSVWSPISDLEAWYAECRETHEAIARDIARSCGGVPGEGAEVDEQYRRRSPLTWLAYAGGLPLHINAGITDGHVGSVPVSHSLWAFNAVARPEDRFSEDEIRYIVDRAAVPEDLQSPVSDLSYDQHQPLLRRSSENATVTIFDGGHEIVAPAAMQWFDRLHSGWAQ